MRTLSHSLSEAADSAAVNSIEQVSNYQSQTSELKKVVCLRP